MSRTVKRLLVGIYIGMTVSYCGALTYFYAGCPQPAWKRDRLYAGVSILFTSLVWPAHAIGSLAVTPTLDPHKRGLCL